MTQPPPDDFEDDFQDDAPPDAPRAAPNPGVAGNIKAAWQGSPLFKLFVLVVGAGALTTAIIALLSGGDGGDRAGITVGGVPGLTATPGSKAPPAYVDAVNDASRKRAEEAIRQERSAIPTPVSGDVTTAGLGPEERESQYDPLAEFRPNIPPDNTVTQAPSQEPVELIDGDLLAKMQQQMTSLFDAWRPGGVKLVQVIDPATLKKDLGNKLDKTAPGARVLIPAGTISYAQLVVEANSDAPGPIMAEVMSGRFTGARVIGQFEATRDYLVLKFTKLTYRRKDYSIDAVALDPNSTLPGLVTEKDNRYFSRVILPAAAGFLEGFGSAISAPSNSVVTENGNVIVFEESKQGVKDGIYRGLSEAAQTAGSFFRDEAAATRPLIRVAAGTPMGLFFVNSMTDNISGAPVETNIRSVSPPVYGPSNPYTNLDSQIVNPYGGTTVTPLDAATQSSLAKGGISVIHSGAQ